MPVRFPYGASPGSSLPPYRRRSPLGLRPDDRPGLLGPGPLTRPARPRVTAPPPRRPPGPATAAPGYQDPLLEPGFDPNARAGQDAAGTFDPIAERARVRFSQFAAEAAKAIAAATGVYSGEIGKLAQAIPGIYDHAKQELGAINSELADRLVKAGKASGKDLAKVGEQAGAALPGDINLAGIGSGAGAAGFGIGSAALEQLVGEQVADQAYGAKLGPIAGLTGLQATRDTQAQFGRDLAEELARIEDDRLRYQADRQSYYETEAQRRRERAEDIARSERERAQDRATSDLDYWNKVAAQRTQDTGYVWRASKDGIRPVDADPRKPGIQRVPTMDRQVAEHENYIESQKVAADVQRENQKHQETMARLRQQEAALNERVRHNQAIEQNTAASTAERRRAAQARERAEAARQRVRQAAQAERERHNRATEKNRAGGSSPDDALD